MSDRITTDTPFGEAFNIIFHALATDKGDDFATFGFTFYRKGDIRHINVKMYSETVTSKNVIEKGHAHCTWTEQFYPTTCCMDINTLLEYIEKGEAAKPAPRRTFEEICVNMAKELRWQEYEYCFNTETQEFEISHFFKKILTINRGGRVWFLTQYISHDALATISAASTEIAANYKAEHGKETQQ